MQEQMIKKKHIMFKLLFLHLNSLFNAYQEQELNKNNFVVEQLSEVQKLEVDNSIKKISSKLNDSLGKLTGKQRQKYLKLCQKL